ncbi:MAG: hypothetical protein VCC01_07930, partial [Candidatus Hydrogenedentota bacterium]
LPRLHDRACERHHGGLHLELPVLVPRSHRRRGDLQPLERLRSVLLPTSCAGAPEARASGRVRRTASYGM